MNLKHVFAVVLFAIGLLALALSRGFPFQDNVPETAKAAIVILGAACIPAGAYLWYRKTPDSESSE